MQQEEQITKISTDLLIPNVNQPRKFFSDESIKELAISIKEYGILNPILVRKKENLYEIIAGERRYRAAKLLGLKEVPVIIKNVDDAKLTAIALIENLQRENISPIEEAKSYQEILKISNLKEQELSSLIGKSQPYISNKLRLLKLPQNIQEALINKKISERHARSLISVNDPDRQTKLLNRIINEKLSVKELETIINEKEITDEVIKSAIDDIMKSLNINLDSENNEKKEEKESDNMNNGNFFPNQPNNVMPDGNMTLNNMNMQTLNQVPPVPGAITPPPAVEPAPTPTVAPSNQPFVYNQPAAEPAPPVEPAPMPTMEVPNPLPDFSVPSAPVEPAPSPIPEPPLPELSPIAAPEPAPMAPPVEPAPMPTIEVPNPLPDFSVPSVPVEPTPSPILEPPLFNPSATMTPNPEPTPEIPVAPTPEVLPSFEVPVELAPSAPQDKLAEVETYLTNNGLNYKKYSNESGHCIIIEL